MVKQMQQGVFEWVRGDAHHGEYPVKWLPADEQL